MPITSHAFPIGRNVHPTSARVASFFYGPLFNDFVAVPVYIAEERFLLDFNKSVEVARSEYKKLNAQQIDTVLRLVLSVSDSTPVSELVDKLISNGSFAPTASEPNVRDSVEKFVSVLVSDLRKRMALSGLTGLIVKDSLSQGEFLSSLSAMREVSLSAISNVSDVVNDTYARYISGEKGDPLATYVTQTIQKSPLLEMVDMMRTGLRNRSSAYTRIRKSHVINQLHKTAFTTEMCEMKEILPGKVGKLSAIDFPELGFADCLYLFHAGVSGLAGFPLNDSQKDVSIYSLANTLATGVGDIVPFLPSQVGKANVATAQKAFQRVLFYHLIDRLLTDAPGEFYARMSASISVNKFFQIDNLKHLLDGGLYTVSVTFEALKDTIAFFREYAKRTDVLFSDMRVLNTHQREKICDFFFNTIYGRVSSVNFSLTHPSYYRQASHFINARASSFLMTDPSYSLEYDEKTISSLKGYLSPDGVLSSVYFGRHFQDGSLYDVPVTSHPYPIPVINRRHIVDPIRIMRVAYSDPILSLDSVKAARSVIRLDEFFKLLSSHVSPMMIDYLNHQGRIVIFSSARELSNRIGVPKEVAETIWSAANISDFIRILNEDLSVKTIDSEPSSDVVAVPQRKGGRSKKTLDSPQVDTVSSKFMAAAMEKVAMDLMSDGGSSSSRVPFIMLPQTDVMYVDVSEWCDMHTVYARETVSASVLNPDGIVLHPYVSVFHDSYAPPSFVGGIAETIVQVETQAAPVITPPAETAASNPTKTPGPSSNVAAPEFGVTSSNAPTLTSPNPDSE